MWMLKLEFLGLYHEAFDIIRGFDLFRDDSHVPIPTSTRSCLHSLTLHSLSPSPLEQPHNFWQAILLAAEPSMPGVVMIYQTAGQILTRIPIRMFSFENARTLLQRYRYISPHSNVPMIIEDESLVESCMHRICITSVASFSLFTYKFYLQGRERFGQFVCVGHSRPLNLKEVYFTAFSWLFLRQNFAQNNMIWTAGS